jgi:hypothetical protein
LLLRPGRPGVASNRTVDGEKLLVQSLDAFILSLSVSSLGFADKCFREGPGGAPSHGHDLLDQLQDITPPRTLPAIRMIRVGRRRAPVRRSAFKGRSYGPSNSLKERPADGGTKIFGRRGFEYKGGAELLGFGLQNLIGYSRRYDCSQVAPCGLAAKHEVQSVVLAEANVSNQERRRNTEPFKGLLESISDRDAKPERRGSGNGKHDVRKIRVDDECGCWRHHIMSPAEGRSHIAPITQGFLILIRSTP